MILRLAILALVVAGCRGEKTPEPAPKKQAPPPPPVAPADATESGLELVACVPAPLSAVEPNGAQTSQVVRGALQVTGSLTAPKLGETLAKHHNRLQFCYEQALTREPTITGTSRLTITLREDGRVFSANVEQSVDDELSLCIKHIVSELTFAAPPKGDRVTATQPLTFQWAPPKTAARPEPTAWTPYAATDALAPTAIAVPAALELGKTVSAAKLASCLSPQHTGSLRTVARIGTDGVVSGARAGGLGDAEVEACIASALLGTKVSPVQMPVDVACDFTLGTAAPWRIAPDAGYIVVDTADELARTPHPKDGEQTFLVLADPATTAETLGKAIAIARRGAAFVLAVRTGDGAPTFVFASRTGSVADPSRPFVVDGKEPFAMCQGLMSEPQRGPDVDKLLAGATRTCTRRPCPAQLTVSMPPEKTAAQVLSVVDAARRAGFERIRLGAGNCPG